MRMAANAGHDEQREQGVTELHRVVPSFLIDMPEPPATPFATGRNSWTNEGLNIAQPEESRGKRGMRAPHRSIG